MKIRRLFLLFELVLIIIYFLMVLLSINFLLINVILGFFIIFILPGYNLLDILKPNSKIIEKLGYSIILSLAIENIFMILCYAILYNHLTYPEVTNLGFIFNSTLLITAILIINLILIIIREYLQFKSKTEFNAIGLRKSILNLDNLKERVNYKIISVLILFGLSIILLCISATYSYVPNNDYNINYVDYRESLTFFSRVPLIFYAFLIISISTLIFIVFLSRNTYIILISLSMFIYCLWILPYLQIDNYFTHDTLLLSNGYQNYINNGLVTHGLYNLVIFNFDSLRYSTGLFTTILLISTTNVNLDFALWYLYPLLYIFIPFFFFSVFNRFSNKDNKKNQILIILVVFSVFMPYFIKSGHASGTGLFGAVIYSMLIVEFYILVQKNKFNIHHSVLIIILYIFLCLTHTEESIYFLFLLILFSFYYPFYEFKRINKDLKSHDEFLDYSLKKEIYSLQQIVEKEFQLKELKNNHIKLGFLLFILFLIFYFVMEFFGWINYYLQTTFSNLPLFEKFFNTYRNTILNIPFFIRGSIDFSYFVLITLFLGVFLFSYIIYFIFFRNYNFMIKITNSGIVLTKKILNFMKKLISNKIFIIIYFFFIFAIIIYIEFFIFSSFKGISLLSIILLIISYLILILHTYFFMMGIQYYELRNDIQNFFLLAILASASVLIVYIITGNIWLSLYFIHSKLSTNFIFFNLLIIQNTFFKDLMKKKYNYLLYIVILVVFLGVFYCFRKLAYG